MEVEAVETKLKLYDKLGDLCCSLKAYLAAIKFYGQQVSRSHVCQRLNVLCENMDPLITV